MSSKIPTMAIVPGSVLKRNDLYEINVGGRECKLCIVYQPKGVILNSNDWAEYIHGFAGKFTEIHKLCQELHTLLKISLVPKSLHVKIEEKVSEDSTFACELKYKEQKPKKEKTTVPEEGEPPLKRAKR
jgi:hypothetical protein